MTSLSHSFLHIATEFAPAYEFILSLAVSSDRENRGSYEIGAEWSAEIGRRMPKLLREVEEFSAGSDMVWAHLISLAYECPAPRDIPTFLTYLDTIEPQELLLRLVGYYTRFVRRSTSPEVILAAVQGDSDATSEFLRTSDSTDPAWPSALAALLATSPVKTKEQLLGILRQWSTAVFALLEPRAMSSIRRDAEEKQIAAETVSARELLDLALPGFEYIPEPGIRTILLIPSYVTRPVIHSFEHHDVKILVYPVSDASLTGDDDAPAPRLVRLLKALADERRLRIVKRLSQESLTLKELANEFDTSSTTMLHHMVILRSAGLVRLGAGKRYALQPGPLLDLPQLLGQYVSFSDKE